MTPYEADLEGMQKSTLSVDCPNIANETCRLYLTYAIRKTVLSLTPYDTDCRTYHDVCYGYLERNCVTSHEACLSDCLHVFTTRYGMVIESNVLSRKQYGKSNHLILPWYFRTMSKGKSLVNMSLFEEDVNKSVKYLHPKSELITKMRTSFPSYQEHFQMCSTFCRRPDCHQESLIPQIMSVRSITNSTANLLDVQVFPPNDQVVTVTSVAKYSLLDL